MYTCAIARRLIILIPREPHSVRNSRVRERSIFSNGHRPDMRPGRQDEQSLDEHAAMHRLISGLGMRPVDFWASLPDSWQAEMLP